MNAPRPLSTNHSPRAAPANGASEFLDRVGDVIPHRSLAVYRFSQRVHNAPQQALAHGHLQQLPRGADLVALLELGVVAQNDYADFGLFEVQCQAGDTVAEV